MDKLNECVYTVDKLNINIFVRHFNLAFVISQFGKFEKAYFMLANKSPKTYIFHRYNS